MASDDRLVSQRFPRSSQYHPDWVLSSVSGGANALWLTEWLTAALDLRPGMRVLDLGCGRASSAMQEVRSYCAGRGIRALYVETGRDNAPALAVYRRAGFVATDHVTLTLVLADPTHAP